VHREQAAGAAHYFGVDDPAMLANRLLYVSQNSGPVTVRKLLSDVDRRVATFADDFASTIKRTLQLAG
jgi:hypothetical protein